MAGEGKPTFLRLISTEPKAAELSGESLRAARENLFSHAGTNFAAVLQMDTSLESDVLTLFLEVRPRLVIDLRIAPRFDLGALNRRLMFSLFEQCGSKYHDLSGSLGLKSGTDARLNPKVLADHLQLSLFKGKAIGPLVFMVDSPQFGEDFVGALFDSLPSPQSQGWEILRHPLIQSNLSALKSKHQIFISHATPEDNDFARWLAAQLSCAGYSVWSDLGELAGGEILWDAIEDAIRNHACKVVVALSRRAQIKLGVLDEINCAISVERSEGRENFVVPLRLDDLPFSEVRANLARKNIIDFSENWATGVARLFEALERDGVPRLNTEGASSTNAIFRARARTAPNLRAQPEILTSNWTPITALPTEVFAHNINLPLDKISDVRARLPWPVANYLRLAITFAKSTDRRIVEANPGLLGDNYCIPLGELLAGNPDKLPGLAARDAHNLVVGMLRKGLESAISERDASKFLLASGQPAFFLRKGLLEGDQVRFVDPFEKVRRKKLVGWSNKKQVFWHFAMSFSLTLGRVPRVVWRPHVVFSEDGVNPLESTTRQHRLRRSFCKSWWNDRWRDLTCAFLAWLADGNQGVAASVADDASFSFDARPISFISPVSLSQADDAPEISDDMLDELAGDDEDGLWFEDEVVEEASLDMEGNANDP